MHALRRLGLICTGNGNRNITFKQQFYKLQEKKKYAT